MKRHIAVFLTLILIMFLIPSVATTVSHAAVLESVWDFEDYDKAETSYDYLARKNLAHIQGTINITNHYLHGKMAKMEAGSRLILWQHPDKLGGKTPIDENFIFEFDFMQGTKAPIADLGTPSSEDWSDLTRACRITGDGTNLILRHKTGTVNLIENYKANTVYNIKLGFDFENETIKVWVNDIAVFTEIKLNFINSIPDISRFDFNNTIVDSTGIYIGKMALYPYNSATEEIEALKEAVFNAKNVSEGFVSGEYLGQYKPSDIDALNETIKNAQKNLFIWEDSVSPDKSAIEEMTQAVNSALEKAQKGKNTQFVEVYKMDFDSMNLENAGWLLTGVTPGQITDDDGNKVYKGTYGTRGLRFFYTPYTKKATISFSFKQNVKAPVTKISEITSETYNDPNRLYCMSSNGTDILINGKTIIENYEAGKWYDILIETDPVTKELRVYVDKKRVLKEMDLPYLGDKATVIGRWETSVGNQGSEILIDNINIYRDVNLEFSEFASELAYIFGDKTSVTENLDLPIAKDGYSIEWTSSDTSVITNSGVVTRSTSENRTVNLTALISRDDYSYKHNYILTVPRVSASVDGQADFVIEERTGHSGIEFFRRGIPFAKGELSVNDSVCLKCGSTTVPVQTEVLEKYADGSVKWLSVSFMWNVQANTRYEFYIVKGNATHTKTANAAISNGTATLSNDTVSATVTKSGITAINYNGTSILGAGGITLCAENTYNFTADTVEVVSSGPVYSQVRLKGAFTGTTVTGDWLITLYAGDSRLYHEFRFTAKGDQDVNTQTMHLSLNGFSNPVYESDAPAENGLTQSDYIILNKNNTYLMLTSKDVTRFSGAINSVGVHNGFMLTGSTVIFAPIQYNTCYRWLDGITRTVRLDMSFYNASLAENEKAREEAWAFTPPSLTVNSERFVTAGIIEDDNMSPALTRTENLMASMYGGLWHHFQAGKLPHSLEIDYETEEIITEYRGSRLESSFNRSGGEVEYNLWKSYMTTGNPVMFDILSESSEYWTDFMVYRGKIEKLQGTNRYQTKDTDLVSFRTNMPFYGDLSGLYMSYLVTGDPYYKESFRLAADFWEKSISDANGLPMLSYWYNPAFPDRLNYNEEFSERKTFQFRFSAMARGMYYAYRLFGDDKYLAAGEDIMDHLSMMQFENGSFIESYYYPSLEPFKNVENDNGELCYSEKHYIMGYGARMLTDFYNLSGYAPGLSNMVKLADYLALKRGDKGFGWSPNSDDEVYAVPSIRGAGSNSTDMVFTAKLYMATGDEKYLAPLAEMFRFYTSSWNGGNTDRVMETGKSTFMESSQTIGKILLDNEEKVTELGYADVIAVLRESTTVAKNQYPEYASVINKRGGRYALNAFDTPSGRVVYLNNSELVTYTAENPGLYKDTAFSTSFKVSTDTNLWYGAQNTVTANGVTMESDVRVVDVIPLMETDVKLNLKGAIAVADVKKYTPHRIEFLVNSDKNFTVEVGNRFFNLEDGRCYVIESDSVKTLVKAENGTIQAEIPAYNTPQSVAVYPLDGIAVTTELVSGGKVIYTPDDVKNSLANVKVTVARENTYESYKATYVAAVIYENSLYDVGICKVDDSGEEFFINDLNIPSDKKNATVKVFCFEDSSGIKPREKAVIFE